MHSVLRSVACVISNGYALICSHFYDTKQAPEEENENKF
jgi:hypothetical protein